MQIFVFFLYNEQAIKLMRFAQNVLTEARVSGLRASVLRTLDRQVPLSFLPSFAQPRLTPARTPGSLSSPRCSLPGLDCAPGSGPGLTHKVQKARSL